MTGVELHIETIAVDGVDVARLPELGAAFEASLARLLVERGVPDRWRSGEVVAPDRPIAIDAGPRIGAELLAERVAAAVYEALAR